MSSGKAIRMRVHELMRTLRSDRPDLSFPEQSWLATRRMSGEIFSTDLRPRGLILLASATARFAEECAAEGRGASPPERPIACRAGCGHCCHISVAAAPAEVIWLAEHIRNHFQPAARSELVRRLRAAANLTRERRLAERLACPLLVDGSCSGYAARPLNCRGLESMDAEACRRASYGEIPFVPIYMARWLLYSRILGGLVAGAADAGRGNEQLDLFPALLIALEEPDAARRWLEREPVFARCVWPLGK